MRAAAFVIVTVISCSISGFADSMLHAEHNAYFHCKHTQLRVERTKACPCGCNKKKRPAARLQSSSSDCDTDDVVAHAPAFSHILGNLTFSHRIIQKFFSVSILLTFNILLGVTTSPSHPPG